MGYRYRAVLMDFGSVREAQMEVSTRSQALQLQVHMLASILWTKPSADVVNQDLEDLKCLTVLGSALL